MSAVMQSSSTASAIPTGNTLDDQLGLAVSQDFYVPSNDTANIDDYGGGRGGDDAAALRLAIASGAHTIIVPPGHYTFKSVVQQWGTAVDPVCVELRGLSSVSIKAAGAFFQVADNIAGDTPVCAMAFTDNAKSDSLDGATFIDTQVGLAKGAENVAVAFESATSLNISNVTVTGQTTAAIAGVYGFDCNFNNIAADGVALGFDISHVQNFSVNGGSFIADNSDPVAGLNLHYDVPTIGDNVVTNSDGLLRPLVDNQSNGLSVADTSFTGFGNSVAVEGTSSVNINDCKITGVISSVSTNVQAGILVYDSDPAVAAAQKATGITINNNVIMDCGVAVPGVVGGGIIVGPSVDDVKVNSNTIIDDASYGIGNLSSNIIVASNNSFGNTGQQLIETVEESAGVQNNTVLSGSDSAIALAFVDTSNGGVPLSTDPLIDPAYILANYGGSITAGSSPEEWFDDVGWKEGANPNAYFNTNYYLSNNQDVAAADVNPLDHYEIDGWVEGRNPSVLFDTNDYLSDYADVNAAHVDPLLHFIVFGKAEGREATSVLTLPSDPLVDASYYSSELNGYTTLTAAEADASYSSDGWLSGLDPSHLFDTSYYLAHNPDVAAAHVDPLLHYETYGWKEGRDPSAAFSTDKYLAAYKDVAKANIDPLLHYVEYGQGEGRSVFAV